MYWVYILLLIYIYIIYIYYIYMWVYTICIFIYIYIHYTYWLSHMYMQVYDIRSERMRKDGAFTLPCHLGSEFLSCPETLMACLVVALQPHGNPMIDAIFVQVTQSPLKQLPRAALRSNTCSNFDPQEVWFGDLDDLESVFMLILPIWHMTTNVAVIWNLR